jgi:hypothetical protein
MDRFFGLDAPANLAELAHVAVFEDPVSPAIAEELLTDAGIPFLKKERGSGTAVRLIAGFQPFGTDFFVRPEDEERAKEALIPLTQEAEIIYEENDEGSNEE